MLYISRWAIYITVFLVLAGILVSVPNTLPANVRAAMPGFLPSRTVNLGLDLQGGSYLLLEVDLNGAIKERMDNLRIDIRTALRKERIDTTLDLTANVLTVHIIDAAKVEQSNKIIRGILQPSGTLIGTSEYEISTPAAGDFRIAIAETYQREMRAQIVSQSIEVVRKRIDELGTKEPTIQAQGDDRILVQVPGLSDPKQLKEVLSTTAKMVYRLVDDTGSMENALKGIVPPDDELLYETRADGTQQPYLVQRRVIVSGDRLRSAKLDYSSQTGAPIVSFSFDTRGAKQFGDATKANVGKLFAIVLDNKVISAPVIRSAILGGSGYIEGNFTAETAKNLAVLLSAGALPASLKVIEERTVGAELGADSINAGKLAALVGLAAVIAFMLLTYGLFGLFATIALTVNMILLMGVLTFLQATLTLPGIAGMVLTMGMAVDANVLIYERIREEMRAGKTLISSIDAGFRRAAATIIDTNATHVLAALILYAVGTGPVRGFAVTLGLGVITSFFTAVMVTRIVIVTWLRQTKPKLLVL